MTEKQPELPAVIPSSRSDNFKKVTEAGNKAVTELLKVAASDADKIAEIIPHNVRFPFIKIFHCEEVS